MIFVFDKESLAKTLGDSTYIAVAREEKITRRKSETSCVGFKEGIPSKRGARARQPLEKLPEPESMTKVLPGRCFEHFWGPAWGGYTLEPSWPHRGGGTTRRREKCTKQLPGTTFVMVSGGGSCSREAAGRLGTSAPDCSDRLGLLGSRP